MFLKIKNKFVNYNLLGKTKKQVYERMERKPDQIEDDLWSYIVDTSWMVQKTTLHIEFEDDRAVYLSVKVTYENPIQRRKPEHTGEGKNPFQKFFFN
ncbi:hypothetical protein [Chryseobacterium flavum]|uniref:hypothetical protein n=1 Tax=Chryseobacterium flavum TaxID=415851 RepID=UPI002FDA55DD